MFSLRILSFIILLSSSVLAQYDGNKFSISSSLVYTTSAEIFLNPNSTDPIARNRSFQVSDLLNPSLDFRYRISEPLIIGLSSEFMTANQSGRNLIAFEGSNEQRLETEDGFTMIPLEASLYYLMPFSTLNFKFLMGAGAGIYFGKFSRTFGDTDISTLSSQTAFGMHVSVSMEYVLLQNIGIKLEMKFRDPEFKNKNKYDKNIVNYKDTQVIILNDTFDTKVNVNGVTFLLGAAFYF